MGIGTSDGEFYKDEFEYHSNARIYISPTPPTMPPEGSTEPVGALKSEGWGEVAYKQFFSPEAPVRPEPYGLNPPEREGTFWDALGIKAKTYDNNNIAIKTKNPLTDITEADIDRGIQAGLSTLPQFPNTVEGVRRVARQIQPPALPVPDFVPPTDPTEVALMNIMDALEGPGAYAKKYGQPKKTYSGDTVKIPITENGKLGDSILSVEPPRGWTDVSGLSNTSPKEASEMYWKLLTTKGEYSAARFEQHYAAAQKGNGHELFSEHVAKKHKENPNQQIPFEEAAQLSNPMAGVQEGQPHIWKDNFYGFNVDLSKLSTKQFKDFLVTQKEFKNGTIDSVQYVDEMSEYVKFTKPGGTADSMAKVAKNDAYIDQFIANPKFKALPEKLKEKAREVINEVNDAFADKMQEMKNALGKILPKEVIEDFAPDIMMPGKAIEKGYIQPAYRGVRIHEGKALNPVHGGADEKFSAMYSSASPLLADMYSAYLSKHPGRGAVKEGKFDTGAQVMPLLINTKDYHYFDAKGASWQMANNKAIEEARQLKKKGVIVDNVWDEPNSTQSLGAPKKIFITLPSGKSTVKSRFAKDFDESSPNMLHSIGIAGPAGVISFELGKESTE